MNVSEARRSAATAARRALDEGLVRASLVGSSESILDGVGDVAAVGGDGQLPDAAQLGARPAGPEQDAHDQAHRGPDGDVAQADEPRAPALRSQQVEEHDDEHREGRLPDDEVDRRGRVRGEEGGESAGASRGTTRRR